MALLAAGLMACCGKVAGDALLTLLSTLHLYSWSGFSAGWTVGGLSGVAFAYILTQVGTIGCKTSISKGLATP